jgi:hypothetical protein
MVRVMSSYRKNSELLLAVLSVFISEPISEWMDQANNLRASTNSAEGSRVLSYARKKIDIARMKLQGTTLSFFRLFFKKNITHRAFKTHRFPNVGFSHFKSF